ncbi:MAG: carboxypeptidase regulatory-like domain-containing protein [Candidatus Aminicenantes bacterium]|nr:carboxypeptidase regulatory-like domain-containing protein [Candidatus Aminicenantes bacterium]
MSEFPNFDWDIVDIEYYCEKLSVPKEQVKYLKELLNQAETYDWEEFIYESYSGDVDILLSPLEKDIEGSKEKRKKEIKRLLSFKELELKKEEEKHISPKQSEKKTFLKEKERRTLAKNPKKWWKKWQSILTALVLLVTFLTFMLDLPKKAKDFYQEITGESQITINLKGVVVDSKGMPIKGAEVKVDALPGESVMTTSDGNFLFKRVPGQVGDSTRVYIYYRGILQRDEYVTLPGPIRIILDDQ